jgi:hypothetical protein
MLFVLIGCQSDTVSPTPSNEVADDPPRMSHVVIESPPSIEITINNRSASDLMFTKRMGYIHANNMKPNQHNYIEHLIDDGFNTDLKLLRAKDLVTVKAHEVYVFSLPCRMKEFQNRKKDDELSVVIDPIKVESFEEKEREKVRPFASKFTLGFKSGIFLADGK